MKKSIWSVLDLFDNILWILHPLLFFLYSLLFLLAENQIIPIQAVIRSLVIGFIIILLLLFFSNHFGNGQRAALLISGIIILFFSYGHLINLIEKYLGKTFDEIGEWKFFLPGFFVVTLWIYFVSKRLRQVRDFTRYFFIVGVIVNLFPLQRRLQSRHYVNVAQEQFLIYQQEMEANLDLESAWVEDIQQRDIYYIVLDAYGRADVLQDLYGYDNTEFLQFLESRGFYIAYDSHSNYDDTELSLSSSFNMSYLSALPETLGAQSGTDIETVKGFAAKLIKTNVLQEYFHSHGYSIIAFESGHPATLLDDADVFLQSPSEDRGSSWRVGFETMLLDSSLGRLLMKIIPKTAHMLDWLFDLHRERILFAIEHLPDYTQDDRPTFIFAHIISPHTPYVFGPNGERIDHQDPFSLLDAKPGNPDNKKYYRDQVHYLNQLLMEMINEILVTSPVEPIIILQGDHGSKVYIEKEPSPEIRCRLHLPILNAYYFPGVDAETHLYPTISPVNSFRIVLNEYFQEDLALLPDNSYKLLEYEGELQFIDFDIAVAACP